MQREFAISGGVFGPSSHASMQVKHIEKTMSTFPSAASALAKSASADANFALIRGSERSFCSLSIPLMHHAAFCAGLVVLGSNLDIAFYI
jgi:hypothetical protein